MAKSNAPQPGKGTTIASQDQLGKIVNSNNPTSRRGGVGKVPVASISPEAQQVLEKRRASIHKSGAMTRGPGLAQQTRQANVQVVRAAPKVFSPLYENSNLQLPRDLRTLNAWNRHFYNINPLVRNAINLHATYPISKFNFQCSDRKVQQFFEDMFDDLNLENVLLAVALEYWKLGEALPYAELDENNGIWSHIFLQNPDYIRVQISPLAKDPLITLIPDEHLKRVVTSSSAADRQLRDQLPPEIVALIQKGLDIPLNNFNISHLKMLSSDYDVRGSSLITACYKDLMLYDKIREAEFVQADDMVNPITHVKLGDPNGCYSEDTEILTENGFKKYNEVQPGEKLATFNPQTECLEYQDWTDPVVYYYDSAERGPMVNFTTKLLDILVTPNHNMFTSRWIYNPNNSTYKQLSKADKKLYSQSRYTPWEFVKAEEIGINDRFRTVVDWNPEKRSTIEILEKQFPIELFAEFIGYFVSEGWAYLGTNNRSYISIGQHEKKEKFCLEIEKSWSAVAEILGVKLSKYEAVAEIFGVKISKYEAENVFSEMIKKQGFQITPGIVYRWVMHHKAFAEFLIENFGKGANAEFLIENFGKGVKNKTLPKWFKALPKEALQKFLTAVINGDGSCCTPTSFAYYTSSQKLADDIQEVALKVGYVTKLGIHRKSKTLVVYGHRQEVSTKCQNIGRFPLVYSRTRALIQKQEYKGYVWCFSVPNRVLITRRNGMIAVQGNSWKPDDTDISDMRQALEEAMYDLDFKLVTHGAVTIERIGAGGAVLDTSRMWEMINKNILIGLMAPEEVINGNGASYASATVGLEVMRSRYERFRNTITTWVRKKLMEPIAKIQDFYKWENGRRRLIVPDIVWNRMNLRDVESYLQNLIQMVGDEPGQGKISGRTVLTLLDIDPDAMEVETRKEMIDAAIRVKEAEYLQKMSLQELMTLDSTKPVTDLHPDAAGMATEAIPGEQDEGDTLGDLMGGGGGLDLGGLGDDMGGDLGGDMGGMDAPTPDLGGPDV